MTLTVLDKRCKVIKTLRDSLRLEDDRHGKKCSYTRQLDVMDYDFKVLIDKKWLGGDRVCDRRRSVYGSV